MTEPSIDPTAVGSAVVDSAAFVEQMALMVGLPLLPEHRQGVVENFERIRVIAQLVTDFPLPDDLEAAPTFHP